MTLVHLVSQTAIWYRFVTLAELVSQTEPLGCLCVTANVLLAVVLRLGGHALSSTNLMSGMSACKNVVRLMILNKNVSLTHMLMWITL